MRLTRGPVIGLAVCCAWAVLTALGPANAARAGEDVSTSLEGRALNGRVVLAQGKILADGVVLIVHGRMAHNRMEVIDAVQTVLAERSRSSLAITLGLRMDDRRGMYDCTLPHRHRHTGALDEIGVWLTWLVSQGARRVVLMGHSCGGNQAAWFVAERPHPAIARLVLLAPSTWSRERDAETYEERYGVPLDGVLARAERLVAEGKGAALLERTGFLYCRDATVAAASFVSYYRPDPRRHTPALLERIKLPVLVIAGTQDEVSEGLIEAVQPLAARQTVRLAVVEDADHFFRDLFAEDVADAIDAFLQ